MPGGRLQAQRVRAALVGLATVWLAIWAGPIYAQPGAESLPGGATSLTEGYDTWTVSCALRTVDSNPVKACATSQEQLDQRSRQRVLAIELKPAATGAVGTLLLPFGLALEQGIALQIDGGPAASPLRFRTCLVAGCIVPLTFDVKMLAALRKATTLKLRGIADGGKEVLFEISLKGFGSAFDRTAALLK
jgi:invasion protein IalB